MRIPQHADFDNPDCRTFSNPRFVTPPLEPDSPLLAPLSPEEAAEDACPRPATLLQHTFYTAGYQSHTPQTLLALACHLNAGIVDVRLQARSAHPHWRKAALSNVFGSRYVHLAPWGNERYKDGPPIQIADFETGLRCLAQWTACRAYTSLILLCQCKEAECCHRTELATRLRELGARVGELDWRQLTETEATS